MTYEQILEILKENSSSKYDDFNNKIVNSSVPTLGCTVPFVRSLARRCSLQDVESFPVHACYEVDLLRGVVVSTCKLPFQDKKLKLKEFARTIENWAVCDCSVVKVPKMEKEQYFGFFCDMLQNEHPFVCRYGIVNLMSNFLDDEHVTEVFANLSTITQWGHYYVDMGVAWLIATAMTKCREQTKTFMESDGRRVLNKFAYNKALQKMRDSFRVSYEDKEWTKSIKMV